MSGLQEVDMPATIALLWDKVPRAQRIDDKSKRILERVLTGAFRPLSRLHKAQCSDTPVCQWCEQGEEEDKEHLFWRCPSWAHIRDPVLRQLQELDFVATPTR